MSRTPAAPLFGSDMDFYGFVRLVDSPDVSGEGDRVAGGRNTDADRRRVEIARDARRLGGCLLRFLLLLHTEQRQASTPTL